MRFALVFAAALGLVNLVSSGHAGEDPAVPAPRTREYSWMKVSAWNERHEKYLERAKQGNCDVLFLGDSITEGWGNNETWQKHYAPRKAVNFGIGGDTTQNVLWRITNGELGGIQPKVVVLMIGTNNFGLHNDKPEDVVRGVNQVVKTLREKLPDAEILLLGMFPRDQQPGTDFRQRIATANAGLAKLADEKSVTYLDMGGKFLAADGTLSKDIMPDFLHLSGKGYEIWAEAIEPKLTELLDAKK
jgi:lysophospholipase L1-like esterase